jgi:hypothetical protein
MPVPAFERGIDLLVAGTATPQPGVGLAQARYDLVDRVLAVTKRAQVEKMGFVGNEAYAGAF